MGDRRYVFWLAGAAWLPVAAFPVWLLSQGRGGPPVFVLVAVVAAAFAYIVGIRRSELGARFIGLIGLAWIPLGGGLELLPVALLSLLAGFWRGRSPTGRGQARP